MYTVNLSAELPDDLLQIFLQTIQDFHVAHTDEIFVDIKISNLRATPEEIRAICARVNPPMQPRP